MLIIKSFSVLICFFLLSACGGGGGGSDSNAPSTPDVGSTTFYAPVAKAGDDQNVLAGSVVYLDANSSYDPDGSIVSYAWTQTDGEPVDLSSSDAAAVSFTAPNIDTELMFELAVIDSDNAIATDTISITVQQLINQRPVANAGTSFYANIGSTVTLNGEQSYDPEGGELTYQWEQISGYTVDLSSAHDVTPSFVAPTFADTLTFSLTVSDGQQSSQPSLIEVSLSGVLINTPPTALAGDDFTVVGSGNISLDGSASFDQEGAPITYLWRQISGERVPLSYSLSATPRFRAPESGGQFSFGLVVNDGRLNSEEDIVQVTVLPANNAPIADAGPDQHVTEGMTVLLNGQNSHDADGDVLTYSWSQVSGPNIQLSNQQAVNPSFIAPDDYTGVLVFQLTVSDGQLVSALDETTIFVEQVNTMPVASAGPDQVVQTNELVVLDGSQSMDAEGDLLSYQWSQRTGSVITLSSSTDVQVTFTAPEVSGDLVFDLLVHDGELVSLADSVTISVHQPNRPPVANAGLNQVVQVSSEVQLNGELSMDPDNDSLSYVWTQTAGETVILADAGTPLPYFTAPSSEQVLRFQLTVDDGEFQSTSNEIEVHVDQNNAAPVAHAGNDQSVLGALIVTLDGSLSQDPDGDEISYLWTQVSGPDVSLNNQTHVIPSFVSPAEGGEIHFQLVVNDGQYDSSPDTVVISVEAQNRPPVAVAGEDIQAEGGAQVTLNGSMSSDPDGDALTYYWQQISGDSIDLVSVNVASPTVSLPETGGEYEFALTVSDGELTSVQDAVMIYATPKNYAPIAEAGDDQVVDPGVAVTLNGSLSSDQNGDALTYQWLVVDEVIQLDDATSVSPSFIAPGIETTVHIDLVVSDGLLSSVADRVSIQVSIENTVPVAMAGDDQTVAGQSVVMLDGSASFDADGDPLSYSWHQLSGSLVSLDDALSAQSSFMAPNLDETLVFELRVNDGQVESAADTVSINVSALNVIPIADAGANQTVTGATEVTLDGSASYDPEGSELSYHWLQLSGPESITLSDDFAVMPVFTSPALGGEFVFQLTVNDGIEDSIATTTLVEVTPINVAPIADAGQDQNIDGLLEVTLDASASYDPNGDDLNSATFTISWLQVAGETVVLNNSNTLSPSFYAPNNDTTLSFTLHLNDGELDSNIDQVNVLVTAVNEAPVAVVNGNQIVTGNDLVSLDASASYDPEGSTITYSWQQTFGDALSLSSTSEVSPTFNAPAEGGLFTFSVTVNDGELDSEPAFITIDVEPANNPPVANAGVDRFVSTGSVVTLLGNRSYDPDEDPLTYTWQQISGPNVVLSSLNDPTPTFTAAEDGRLEFNLIANDGELDSAPDSIVVTVGVIPVTNTKINDTGILWGGDYPVGNNENCTGDTVQMQDCYQGRDLTHNDDTDGVAGFDYTKISQEGVEISFDATEWDCVKDDVTGLIWEVKKGGNGIVGDEGSHDADDLYDWYNEDPSSNGGSVGFDNDDGAVCAGYDETDQSTYCNTQAYVGRINAEGYCGYSDWRIPTRKELLSLVNYGASGQSINTEVFPHGGVFVWSSTPFAVNPNSAWGVSFGGGNSFGLDKRNAQRVRLVRSAP